MTRIIIGLGHYARTGKDTFARLFIERCREINPEARVERHGFADKLKDIAHQLYGWAGLREQEFYETDEGAALREVVLPDLGKSPRQIWVDLGTPAIRANVYDRTWIDCVLRNYLDLDVLVIPDVRFPNEVEAIRELGGVLIKVVRPGYGPGNNVADRALSNFDGWDYVIGGEPEDEPILSLLFWATSFAMWTTLRDPCHPPKQCQESRLNNLAVEAC